MKDPTLEGTMTIGYYAIDNRELEYALDDRQFALSLQPIINITQENFETLEVFVRWHHPLLGMLPPSLFIPQMAREGLMHRMTDYIIHEAIDICKLSRAGGKAIGVNININFNELHDEATLISLDQATFEMEDPENVCLELSSQILSKFSEIIGVHQYFPDTPPSAEELKYLQSLKFTLEKYADLGVTLALDTYDHILGAIDRAKILGLHAIKVSPKLITQSIDNDDYLMRCYEKAEKEEIALIATGVENLSHMKTLINSKINYVQGMFMCPPVYQQQLSNWHHDNLIEAKRITNMLSGSTDNLRKQREELEALQKTFSKTKEDTPVLGNLNFADDDEEALTKPAMLSSIDDNFLTSQNVSETNNTDEESPSLSSPMPAMSMETKPKKRLGFKGGSPLQAKASFGKKAF